MLIAFFLFQTTVKIANLSKIIVLSLVEKETTYKKSVLIIKIKNLARWAGAYQGDDKQAR